MLLGLMHNVDSGLQTHCASAGAGLNTAKCSWDADAPKYLEVT